MKLIISFFLLTTFISCSTTSSMFNESEDRGEEKAFQVSMEKVIPICREALNHCGQPLDEEIITENDFKLIGSGGVSFFSWGSVTRIYGKEENKSNVKIKVFSRARSHANSWATKTDFAPCIFDRINSEIASKKKS